MKEFNPFHTDPVNQVGQVAQIKKDNVRFLGSKLMHRGHTCFSFDPVTEKIEIVLPEQQSVLTKEGKMAVKKSIVASKDKYYTFALNQKNAEKKFKRMIANA